MSATIGKASPAGPPGETQESTDTTTSSDTSKQPPYLKALGATLVTIDGRPIEIWRLTPPSEPAHLSGWAKRFRQQYCPDGEIDVLRSGTGYSKAEFLRQILFPDKSKAPGPSIRAGDFAELLVSDYIEFLLGYWVPRGKYADKAVRNESVKGVDILGFKLLSAAQSSPADELLTFEVKAQLTGAKCTGRLQEAIDESGLDYLRRAMTLNATKRRLLREGEVGSARTVERFQNPTDHPYVYKSGAAAVLSDSIFDPVSIQLANTANHPNQKHMTLLVIRGADLMSLVHAIYDRAADEA